MSLKNNELEQNSENEQRIQQQNPAASSNRRKKTVIVLIFFICFKRVLVSEKYDWKIEIFFSFRTSYFYLFIYLIIFILRIIYGYRPKTLLYKLSQLTKKITKICIKKTINYGNQKRSGLYKSYLRVN